MQYKKTDNVIIVRLGPKEEILSSLRKIAERENIRLAEVSAIGATCEFTAGVYDLKEKVFKPVHFQGTYEITSLLGSITLMNGQPYIHVHINAADEKGNAVGGHLSSCTISATCEMFIKVYEGEVSRVYDEATGLNIFDI